jgi:hypothetical protein
VAILAAYQDYSGSDWAFFAALRVIYGTSYGLPAVHILVDLVYRKAPVAGYSFLYIEGIEGILRGPKGKSFALVVVLAL